MRRKELIIGIAGMALGLGVGAAAMALLDPQSGRHRRARLRDQQERARRRFGRTARGRAKDATERSRGKVAAAHDGMSHEEVPDDKLVARVRVALGQATGNAGAISVAAEESRVTLSGPVLREELEEVLDAVASVRGVREIRNLLTPYENPGSLPGLQGTH